MIGFLKQLTEKSENKYDLLDMTRIPCNLYDLVKNIIDTHGWKISVSSKISLKIKKVEYI